MSSASPSSSSSASSSSSPSLQQQPSTSSLMRPTQSYNAIVLGASGATGRVLVGKLANNPQVTKINAIVRKELPATHFGSLLPANANKITQTVVNFDDLKSSAEAFHGYKTAFCCLGSTRSKAGSKTEFYAQDFGVITKSAEACREGGVEHFALVSSSGSDAKSFFHYLRTKGEIEEYLKSKVQFPSLSIFRPGLLLTDRPNESRWGEWFAQKIVPTFHFVLPEKSCGVYVQTVAEALMKNAEFVLAKQEQAAAAGNAPEGESKSNESIAAPSSASASRIFENDEIRAMNIARL